MMSAKRRRYSRTSCSGSCSGGSVRIRTISEWKEHLKYKVPERTTDFTVVDQRYLANTSNASKISSVANNRELKHYQRTVNGYRKSCNNHLRVLCLSQRKFFRDLSRLQDKIQVKEPGRNVSGSTPCHTNRWADSAREIKKQMNSEQYIPLWQKSSRLPTDDLSKLIPNLTPYTKNPVIDAKFVPMRRPVSEPVSKNQTILTIKKCS